MRKYVLVCGLLAAAGFVVVTARAEDKDKKPETAAAAAAPAAATGDKKEMPEVLTFDKAKLGAVKFPHKKHAEMLGGCAACHEGKEPLFAQKFAGGLKMADMKAGKSCGACHNGKEMVVGKVKKTVFSAGSACMKCHKKS